MSLAVLIPSLWVTLLAATVEASQASSASSKSRVKAAVDSLLRKDAARGGSEDGGEEEEDAEAESADSGAGSKAGLPFALKKPTRQEVKAFQLAVVRAVNAMEAGKHGRAAKVLARTEPAERLAQVYRALLLATAYEGMGDFVRADSVLRACLEWVGGSVWRNQLLDRRIRIFAETNPTDSARLEFYSRVIQASVPRAVKVDFLYELLGLQGYTGSPAGHEELLERLVSLAPGDKRLDSLYRKLQPFAPHGQGDWKIQNILLEAEGKLGLLDEAVKRSEAMLPLVPGKAEKQKLHWNFVSLHYRQKEYRKAISLYEKYIERYGDSPDAYLQIARSHDRLGESRKSLHWYEKFLEKYPRHSKSSEIYWLRGWEFEQQGRYEEAIEQYFRQHADFRTNRRGDWANFRIGLCHYKAGNFSAALQSFKAIRAQENSNAFSAGLFWEGASLEAMKDSAAARAAFVETYLAYPFQFYGHLARQALMERNAWADSLEPWTRFAPSSSAGIRKWMKEGMSGYSERISSDFESDYMGLGKLLQFKLDTLAILTLRTIPGRVKNNPLFLYVYARKFRDRQLWRESYRLGLQLSYRIPETRWGSAPREILRLIYPRPYEGLVQKFSAQRGLDPGLVYALMRQESGFDRKIKSSAGALGLMQIMPATGRTLARKEGLSGFEAAMLTDAESNIRLGTAYLQDLKKDYKGNSYFVLANYNAGPEPARRWLREHGDKPLAMMVEDISYWETRGYVKKVMGNYWTYRILWNNRSKSGSPETVAR
jgi:soluble lytic murein transglycosylase-like protein/outer membrane protein assembly factor BamD (BamD/ComL family)